MAVAGRGGGGGSCIRDREAAELGRATAGGLWACGRGTRRAAAAMGNVTAAYSGR